MSRSIWRRPRNARRYLLVCALSSTKEKYAFTAFVFRERGLPAGIRSDKGVPFASAHAQFNLSKLAVWWLRLVSLGIGRRDVSRRSGKYASKKNQRACRKSLI